MDGAETANVPVTSHSVLTVREQANLLQAFRSMRDIAVKRSFPCPFNGCTYSFNPDCPGEAHKHISRLHVSKKCIWCDETHFEWWNEAQRQRHLRQKHRDKLLATLGVSDPKLIESTTAEDITIELMQTSISGGDDTTPVRTTAGPALQPIELFCGACGRDKRNFTCMQEKNYHDRMCRSGDFVGANCLFCIECGEYVWPTEEEAAKHGKPYRNCSHWPSHAVERYCGLCGIDILHLGKLDGLHRASCRGCGNASRPFCAYCGDRIVEDDSTSDRQALFDAHIASCSAKPSLKVVHRILAPSPAGEPPSPVVPSPVSSNDYQPDDDADSGSDVERGRSKKRQQKRDAAKRDKAAVRHERRAPSPDWIALLGNEDSSFVPNNSFYCSKCLRRVPKANRRRGDKDAEQEYKVRTETASVVQPPNCCQEHIAKNKCCRIRNGIGSVDNLPNRSGWIPASKIGRLATIKTGFLKSHPDYKPTLYPLRPADARTNMWRSDPNNDSNAANWALPWPPYLDKIPTTPTESEASDNDDVSPTGSSYEPDFTGNTKKMKAGKKRVRNQDGGYSYESESDSADGLSADENDLTPGRRKRRRLGDATYRPPRNGEDSDSDRELAEGGPEKLKKVREEMELEMQAMQEGPEDDSPQTFQPGAGGFIAPMAL